MAQRLVPLVLQVWALEHLPAVQQPELGLPVHKVRLRPLHYRHLCWHGRCKARATWRLQLVQLQAPLHPLVRVLMRLPGQRSVVQLHWMVRAPQLVLQQQWRLQLGQAGAPLLGPQHLGRAPAHQMGQLLETQHLEQAQALRLGHWLALQPQEQPEVQSWEACPTRPPGPLRACDPALLQLWRSPVHAPQALGHSAQPQSLCPGLTFEEKGRCQDSSAVRGQKQNVTSICITCITSAQHAAKSRHE